MTDYNVGDVVDAIWRDPDGVIHGVEATVTEAHLLTAATVTMCLLGLPEAPMVFVDGDDTIDCDPCLADKWDGSLRAVLDEGVVADALAPARDLIVTLTEHRKRWLFR